jgi:hypothetical protein
VAAKVRGERLVRPEQGEVIGVGELSPPAARVLDHPASRETRPRAAGRRLNSVPPPPARGARPPRQRGCGARRCRTCAPSSAPSGSGSGARGSGSSGNSPPFACRGPGRGARPGAKQRAARLGIHVPDPPAEHRLDRGFELPHAGAGCSTGSVAGAGTGAGAGVGSSTGTTSISRSLSGLPMSRPSSMVRQGSQVRKPSTRATSFFGACSG